MIFDSFFNCVTVKTILLYLRYCTFTWEVGNKLGHDALVSTKPAQSFLGTFLERETLSVTCIYRQVSKIPTRYTAIQGNGDRGNLDGSYGKRSMWI